MDWIKERVNQHIKHSYSLVELIRNTSLRATNFWRYCRENPDFKKWLDDTLEQNRKNRFEHIVLKRFNGYSSISAFLQETGITRYAWSKHLKENPALRKEVRRRIQQYKEKEGIAYAEMEVPSPEMQEQNYLNYIRTIAEEPASVNPERREQEKMNSWGDWFYSANL